MFYLPDYHLTEFINSTNTSDPNCTTGVPWIWKVMDDCVRTDNEIASTYLGLASMLIWMTCGIPQMIQNCKHLDGMAGISFFLMFQWFLGDSTNLIGSILTKQLKVQIYVAVWYVTSDTILLCQYLAYRIKNKKPVVKEFSVQAVLCIGGLFLLGGAKTYHQFSPLGSMTVPQSMYTHHSTGRNLLMVPQVGHMHIFKNNVELTGYIIGSISAVFYVGSRFSQIYTNYKLRSTSGLSQLMFWFAVLGNLFYGLAIIVRDIDKVFIIKHLPWIIGSLGIIILDITILCQVFHYKRQNYERLREPPLITPERVEDPTFIE
ncbi:hypothetical protein LOTGIDRAFT_222169 [Lottia gigantea]|uniref:PQ-loop repeat-containing protein 2 n=1 Tax=Lottia gigantea TaxID=225164 RepID=V4B6Z0_LOTGI|nr:hypothetical protein LOTGIDRAFT_222169 [Lottia gigantea]ESO84324.1 hypothetical protein LOTGIDRAFT_222169 [Lottia gigantea]